MTASRARGICFCCFGLPVLLYGMRCSGMDEQDTQPTTPVWHTDNDGMLWAWVDGRTVYVDSPDEYIPNQ